MPASTILLLASDAKSGDSIKTILSGAGLHGDTCSPTRKRPIAQVAEHQLVIIDTSSGPTTAVEICRQIRATPAMSAVPVMCVSATEDVEERIAFLEAGADDVMARPFDAREMEARVEALLLRFQRSKDLAPGHLGRRADPRPRPPDGGRLQPQGRRRHDDRGDQHRDRGGRPAARQGRPGGLRAPVRRRRDAPQPRPEADHRGRRPRRGAAERARAAADLRDAPRQRSPRARRTGRAGVGSETITKAHVKQILSVLLDGYDMVVVDAGSTLDERVLTIFEAAESVILTVTPEIGALKSMHALLEYLGEAGTLGLKSSSSSTTCSRGTSSSCATSRASWARRWPSSCHTTHSST